MPLSAVGVIGLWILALREYDLFHLLDYLALGAAVAGYLALASSQREALHARRFEVLRWGIAIALMWSSLEKFAYPEWFYPLVAEKPFLTFGIPRDVFIPMAGVAEFTLGFGLIGTPLVRRLSALALMFIFVSAVWPFGRVDLVGHALIMAMLVVVIADPTPTLRWWRPVRESMVAIPLGLAAALAMFELAHWALHMGFYGAERPVAMVESGLPTRHDGHGHHPDLHE